jgi:hypothetical protein
MAPKISERDVRRPDTHADQTGGHLLHERDPRPMHASAVRMSRSGQGWSCQ